MKIWILLLIVPFSAFAQIKKSQGTFDIKDDPAITSLITVDLKDSGHYIEKQFYGSHIDSYSSMPNPSLVHELGIGRIRIGGNDFDVYNYKLKKTINKNGEIINALSLEDLSRSMAAFKVQGIYQINLTGFQPDVVDGKYVISRNFDAVAAADLIKHLNGKLKLKITDVSLGNEFSIWHETHPKVWPSSDGISADQYIDRFIEYAFAVKKAQESISGNAEDIKIWGPEISTSWYDWNTANFETDCQWTNIPGQVNCSYGEKKISHFFPYFFKRIRKAENDRTLNPRGYRLLDYVSIHYYPNFRTKNSDPTSVITNETGVQKIEEMLESTRIYNDATFVNRYDISSYRNMTPNILGRIKKWISEGYPEAKLAINEFALDSDYRSNFYHPIIRPLYLADSLGIFINEEVDFFNLFQLSSNKSSGLPWSLIQSNEKTPLFYTYQLFTNNILGQKLKVTDNMDDTINAYATHDEQMINLAVVNKSAVAKAVKIYVKSSRLNKLITYIIPGWSTSVLRFNKEGPQAQKHFDIFTYGAAEMGISLK